MNLKTITCETSKLVKLEEVREKGQKDRCLSWSRKVAEPGCVVRAEFKGQTSAAQSGDEDWAQRVYVSYDNDSSLAPHSDLMRRTVRSQVLVCPADRRISGGVDDRPSGAPPNQVTSNGWNVVQSVTCGGHKCPIFNAGCHQALTPSATLNQTWEKLDFK